MKSVVHNVRVDRASVVGRRLALRVGVRRVDVESHIPFGVVLLDEIGVGSAHSVAPGGGPNQKLDVYNNRISDFDPVNRKRSQ